jgi:hypothetical protein
MRSLIRRAVVVAAAAVVLLGPAVGVANATGAAAGTRLGAGQDGSVGTWGKAKEVPGTATLNTGGSAAIISLSCASAGNCSAGGAYTGSSGGQAFVVSQVGGTWGKAKEVPGTATLNTGGLALLLSVSCASAGNCSAGGFYTDSSGFNQAFVVSQVGGKWGKAEEVPGTAALNTGGSAQVLSVSCASPGNCSAGGNYATSSTAEVPFVVSQVGGTWGKAKTIPGSVGAEGMVFSVSCASAGNCSAGGASSSSSGFAAFVVSQVRGTWGKAKVVGRVYVSSVSCASAGNCSAGGSSLDSSGHQQAFVVSQVHGTWGTAQVVPGTAALNQGGSAQLGGPCTQTTGLCGTLSCASAGNCSASGTYTDSSGRTQAFVVSQVNGTWGKAKEVPGTATLNTGGNAAINSLSCASAGNCSAGGSYTDSSGHAQAFVVSES